MPIMESLSTNETPEKQLRHSPASGRFKPTVAHQQLDAAKAYNTQARYERHLARPAETTSQAAPNNPPAVECTSKEATASCLTLCTTSETCICKADKNSETACTCPNPF